MTDIGPDYDDPADDENEEDTDDTCHICDGTGEGLFDGTRCRSCNGSGVLRLYRDNEDFDPPEPNYCDEEGNRI